MTKVTFGEAIGRGDGGTARMHSKATGIGAFYEFTRPIRNWDTLVQVGDAAKAFAKDVRQAVMEAGRESGVPMPKTGATHQPEEVAVGELGGKVVMMLRGSYTSLRGVPEPPKDVDELINKRLKKLGWKVIRG